MINEKLMEMSVKRSDYGQFMAPLLHFYGGNEEYHGTPHSKQPVKTLKSEPLLPNTNNLTAKFNGKHLLVVHFLITTLQIPIKMYLFACKVQTE